MLTIAVIGIGYLGKNILRVFSQNCNVKYCVNLKSETSELEKLYPEVIFTREFSKVLKDVQVDAVVIATPAQTHYHLAKQALNAGKHVFVEKPICTEIVHAKKLVETAKKKKRNLFVGHIFTYHPCLQKLKELTEKDPVVSIDAEWNKNGPHKDDMLIELLPHDFSLAMVLMGKIKSWKIHYTEGQLTSLDKISLELEFPGKKKYRIKLNRVHPLRNRTLQIRTKKGENYLWNADNIYQFDKTKNDFFIVFQNNKEPLEEECTAFLKSTEKRFLQTGKTALEALKIIMEIQKQTRKAI